MSTGLRELKEDHLHITWLGFKCHLKPNPSHPSDLWVKWGQLWEQDLVLLIAVGEGVHVGVVDEGVVAISPGELLHFLTPRNRQAGRSSACCESGNGSHLPRGISCS